MATKRDFSLQTRVEGLKELRRELKAGGSEMTKKLQQVNKQLVTRVADKAQGKFYRAVSDVGGTVGQGRSSPSVRRSGRGSVSRSKASIRGTAGQTSASVVAGGPKAPGFFGHEFGGGARPSTRQFPRHRGREGYVLYPTIRRELKTADKDWNDIFDEVFERTGPL